jgi:ParB family chromosome partitioning protein
MPAAPAPLVEMIPIDRITIVNPRVRNRRNFKEIVDNIAQVGLKRPITVTRRAEADDTFYDLVCGQGRLEALRRSAKGMCRRSWLLPTPKIVSSPASSKIARRQHQAIDLLQDIRGMQERDYTSPEIARKTGLSLEYVHGVARLIEKGEQRLLHSVEAGLIPVRVAVEIAEAEDRDVQATLSNAYERGLLKGRKLLAAPFRRCSREGLPGGCRPETLPDPKDGNHPEPAALHHGSCSPALRDERFVALLEDEDLATMPENIAARLRSNEDPARWEASRPRVCRSPLRRRRCASPLSISCPYARFLRRSASPLNTGRLLHRLSKSESSNHR